MSPIVCREVRELPCREMRAGPPESSSRPSPTTTVVAQKKFVPPKPTSHLNKETEQGSTMNLQEQRPEGISSPARQPHQRNHLRSQENVRREVCGSPNDNANNSSRGRPPGQLYVFFTESIYQCTVRILDVYMNLRYSCRDMTMHFFQS